MSKRTWYVMALDVGSKTSATIDIFDEIGLFGVTAAQFRDDLKALGEDVSSITIRINSPGGSVFETVAMHAMLEMHPAEITVQIIGVAASSASLLATVGDTVQIAENGFMMIHSPSTVAMGNDREMRRVLNMLEKVRAQMVSAYSKKSGLDRETVETLMSEETWFNSEEAVEHGFADEIIGAVEVTASFDLARVARSVPAGAKELFARRNQKESPMDPKGKKTAPAAAETAEEMEARIRAEVTAELKAAAEAEEENGDDEDEGGEPKAKKNAKKDDAPDAKATEDRVRAEFAQIADACLIAGVPEKAAEFISAKKSLSQVMADLKKMAMEGLSNGRTSAHNNGGFDPKGSGAGNIGNAEDLDVDAIYAKWNSPKRGPRAGRATN